MINLLHAHGSPTGYLYGHRGCRCVACRGAMSAFHAAFRATHREELAAKQAAYYATHREKVAFCHATYNANHREEVAARNRHYREAHPEREAAYSRDYHAAHPEKAAESGRRWREANVERVAASKRNRRARKRATLGTHTAADILTQYERQRGRCYWCGVKVSWRKKHIDHVIPLILGGSNGPENLVISCPTCNLKKRAAHPMDFAGVLF